jgi:hypothetical protein
MCVDELGLFIGAELVFGTSDAHTHTHWMLRSSECVLVPSKTVLMLCSELVRGTSNTLLMLRCEFVLGTSMTLLMLGSELFLGTSDTLLMMDFTLGTCSRNF